jgi:hypothetical protein
VGKTYPKEGADPVYTYLYVGEDFNYVNIRGSTTTGCDVDMWSNVSAWTMRRFHCTRNMSNQYEWGQIVISSMSSTIVWSGNPLTESSAKCSGTDQVLVCPDVNCAYGVTQDCYCFGAVTSFTPGP